jgi:hypothetical protein
MHTGKLAEAYGAGNINADPFFASAYPQLAGLSETPPQSMPPKAARPATPHEQRLQSIRAKRQQAHKELMALRAEQKKAATLQT